MIYPYRCTECRKEFDVVKPVKDFDSLETCPDCDGACDKLFTHKVHFIGTKVQDAEFNPGLGCVVKNSSHRKEIAKQKELIEVGNETPDTLHRESVVKKEESRQKEWDAL